MTNLPSGLTSVQVRIRYSSKNDVVWSGEAYLENVLYAIGVNDVEIRSEIATFNRCPDLWVLSMTDCLLKLL